MCVIKGHGLDVQGTQNRFLVDEIAVITARIASGQDDAHVAHVYVNGAKVGTVQRRPLATHTHTPRDTQIQITSLYSVSKINP